MEKPKLFIVENDDSLEALEKRLREAKDRGYIEEEIAIILKIADKRIERGDNVEDIKEDLWKKAHDAAIEHRDYLSDKIVAKISKIKSEQDSILEQELIEKLNLVESTAERIEIEFEILDIRVSKKKISEKEYRDKIAELMWQARQEGLFDLADKIEQELLAL